jgi:hypothetical protein
VTAAIYIPFAVAWFLWSGLLVGCGVAAGWMLRKIFVDSAARQDERQPVYTARVRIDGQDYPPMVAEGVRWRLDLALAELLDDRSIRAYTLEVQQ